MQKIKLGQSDLQVSQLCLGTMYFGSKVDEATSFQLLDQYVEAGGNFIDTSNNYAFWMEGHVGDESEIILGNWLCARQNRSDIVLATKVGARPKYHGAGMDELEGLSYQTIITAVEGSLKRLKTDCIGLYYAHVDWYDYPIEERLKAFDKLKNDGKIREIGASNLYPWRFEKSQKLSLENGWPQYCCVQQKHTYLRPKYNADFWVQKLISNEWMDYAKENDTPLIAYSPLLSGAYSKNELPAEYQTNDNEIRLDTILTLAKQMNTTVNQVVLAWMLRTAPKVLPLISASRLSQLAENLDAVNLNLQEQEIQ